MGWPFGTKKGNLLLFDAGQAGRVLSRVLAEFTTESLSRVSVDRGKSQVTRCGMGEGGRRPDAVRQCTRAGSILFYFISRRGSLDIFFYYNPLGVFFYLWTQHCTTLTYHTLHAPSIFHTSSLAPSPHGTHIFCFLSCNLDTTCPSVSNTPSWFS